MDAKNFLARAGLDCNSDLGVRSPFRFLRDPCPAVCETCIANCASTVLIFYQPFTAGLYDMSVRVNGNEMSGVGAYGVSSNLLLANNP